MREETHQSLRRLFEQVIDLPAGERAARLDRECTPSLRPRLEAMLAAAESDGTFLADPPPGAAPTVTAPAGERPGAMIGRYKLLEQIGEGGFGVVFLAEQREPVHRRVALKIIKLGMDTKAVIARFEAERQALAMMDHANISRVLEAGATETGRPYFVMELVKGQPITHYCDKLSLGIPERLALFTQVCHAVQHAHAKGVIHRDLKPSNILVSTQDGRPLAKVIDFGIAKATDHRLTERTLFTEHRAFIGTPEYMSPEQAEGSLDIDTRSDVYALGVLLYELLTGATPFDPKQLRAAAYAEIQRIIREEEPPKPSTRVSTLATIDQVATQRREEPRKLGKLLRGDLDWIVMRSLEKDRSRRYETAASLAEDVQRHLAHEPVLAGPPGAAYRLRKFVRRHKAGVAAGSLVAAALVLGMAGTSAGMVWALREQGRAEQRRVEAEAAREGEREQRELAQKRENETEQVARFQAAMLSGFDVKEMGRGIKERFRDKVRAVLERQYVGEIPDRRQRTKEEIEVELAAFDRLAGPAQAVDVARRVMDEFVLARAAEALEKQFPDQPLVRARLHDALGKIYQELGLYDAAEQHLRTALEIRQRESVTGHAMEHSLYSLAHLLAVKGDFAAAEPLAREALDHAQREHGDESPQVAKALILLAECLDKKNDDVEAERLYRDALDMNRKLLGDKSPDTAASLNGLAVFLGERGDYAAAEELYTEALAIDREAYGDGHSSVAATLQNLGRVLANRGDYAGAEQRFHEALALRRNLQGDDHPHVALLMGLLGEMMRKKGDYAAAESWLREALDIHRKQPGDPHELAWCLEQMAEVLYRQHQYGAAEERYREALSIALDQPENDPAALARILHHLARWLRDTGKPEEALPFAQQAVGMYAQRPKQVDVEHLHALDVLADIHGDLGQHGAAEERYREALSIALDQPESDPAALARILHHLAGRLRYAGKPEEALPFAQQAVDIYRQRPEHVDDEYFHALEVLADIHGDLGQHGEAVALAREARTIANADSSPKQRDYHRRAIDLLFHTLVDSGKSDEAIQVRREFVEECRRLLPAEDSSLASALAMLGELLLEQDEDAEAELVLRECAAIRENALGQDSPAYWLLANARSMLGGALAGQAAALIESDAPTAISKFTEAEPLLIESAEWLTRNAERIPQQVRARRLRKSMERITSLYESWDAVAPGTGKADRAAEWRAKLEKSGGP